MNSFIKINPALIDAPIDPSLLDPNDPQPGYPAHLAAEDTPDVLWQVCGSASRTVPKTLIVPENEWKDRALDNDKKLIWGVNRIDRFTNQSPTHECTCHSLRANFEACRNRQRGVIFEKGPQKGYRYDTSKTFGTVWVSPLSVYAKANPRKYGGANVRQVCEIAFERGFLPEKIQPGDYGFEHTLQGTTGKGGMNQSSGDWVSESNFPEGWRNTAALLKPLEVMFPASFEEAISLLLCGYVVSVGRDGHAVPWCFINFASEAIGYVDSYDVIRYDSFSRARRAWSGAFSIATVTSPNSWYDPANRKAA